MLKIYNGDCVKVTALLPEHSIDCVVTSPPFGGKVHVNEHRQRTYDVYNDEIDVPKYNAMCFNLFTELNRVMKKNGVVCWEVSYNKGCSEQFVLALNEIITKTPFTIADVMIWKKASALPIPDSPNRLSRICEMVYILVRREDYETYYCNKPVTSVTEVGRNKYGNVTNLIVSKNNDGMTELNGATFSTDFARQLLDLYCPKGGTVYDPFMGTGTTASAARDKGLDCYGAELSAAQCEYAKKRLDDMFTNLEIVKLETETENKNQEQEQGETEK